LYFIEGKRDWDRGRPRIPYKVNPCASFGHLDKKQKYIVIPQKQFSILSKF
jgi:hypothetical protein